MSRLVRRPIRAVFKDQHQYDIAEDTASIINGNVSYGDGTNKAHVDGMWAFVADTGLADTEFSITHDLKRVPVGFHVVNKNKSTDIYSSTTAWTVSQIFLKSTIANAAVRLFIF